MYVCMYVLLSACVYANAQDQHRCAGTDADVDTRAYPHPRPALVSLTLAVARSTNVYIYIHGKNPLACLLATGQGPASWTRAEAPPTLKRFREQRLWGPVDCCSALGVGVGGSVRSL